MQRDLPEIIAHVLDLRQLGLLLMLRIVFVALHFVWAVVGFAYVFVLAHFFRIFISNDLRSVNWLSQIRAQIKCYNKKS